MYRVNFAKLPPGLKKEKINEKENWKAISDLKPEHPINQKTIFLRVLNQIVSDLTD